jgi:hypothetical protein
MKASAMLWVCLFLNSGCAVLHHVQIGDIEGRGFERQPIDIKVSELGINLNDAAYAAGKLAGAKAGRDGNQIAEIIGYFQMGPRTGNPVYVSDYARKVVDRLWEACPSGRITGVQSVRETRSYPVISGEIVKIKAECLAERGN